MHYFKFQFSSINVFTITTTLRKAHIIFAIMVMVINIPVWADSEPLTLEVCQRETVLSSVESCLEEIEDYLYESLLFVNMDVRDQLSVKKNIQSFDEVQSAWWGFLEKECRFISQTAKPGKEAIVSEARCRILNIKNRTVRFVPKNKDEP